MITWILVALLTLPLPDFAPGIWYITYDAEGSGAGNDVVQFVGPTACVQPCVLQHAYFNPIIRGVQATVLEVNQDRAWHLVAANGPVNLPVTVVQLSQTTWQWSLADGTAGRILTVRP